MPPALNTAKSPTESGRIKITWCGSIPSHTKPLLLSWIVSSTLMTIQYSLQAADERPIRSSICCGPNSPDASLVRGPLRANWKTEAISQRQRLCVCVCVCRKTNQRERKERKILTKDGESKEEGMQRRKRDIPLLAETADLSAFVPMQPYWKSPRGHWINTTPKPASCN